MPCAALSQKCSTTPESAGAGSTGDSTVEQVPDTRAGAEAEAFCQKYAAGVFDRLACGTGRPKNPYGAPIDVAAACAAVRHAVDRRLIVFDPAGSKECLGDVASYRCERP